MARSKGVVVQISAEDNTARAFESVNAQVAALRQQVSDLRSRLSGGGPGQDLAQGMGHAVPEIAAASAAIREFEGSLPIRAVERFLTTTLGLGPVLAKAFPLVGFAAFAGMAYEAGNKLYEMEQKGKHAGEELNNAFGEMNEKLRTANDELALSNAKLEDEIGKLSGHPTNGLASALAEARVEADKLQDSLAADLKALNALMKEHEVGQLEGMISGVASNSGAEKEISDVSKGVEQAGRDAKAAYDKALEEAGSSQAKQEAAAKAYYARMAEIPAEAARKMRARATDVANDQKNYDAMVADAASQGVYGGQKDYTPQRSAFEDAAVTFDRMQDRAKLSGTNVSDTKAKDELTAQREASEAKKRAEEALKRKQEAEQRLLEAQEKFNAAKRALDDAEVRNVAAQHKAQDDAALDALESKHKAMLISDAEYYAQRKALQDQTTGAQRDAIAGQSDDAYGEYKDLLKHPPASSDPAKRVEWEAKLLELKTKITELDAKDAEVVAAQAKSAEQLADAETARTKAREATEDRAAAALESIVGGSVAARQRESNRGFGEQFDKANAQPVDDQTLVDLMAAQMIAQDRIAAQGAEQTRGGANATIAARRASIDGDESHGRISTVQAQQEKIALNQEEADSLQPVLAAYQKLAEEGDLAATEKVAQLKQQIAELKDPINETALEVRNQLDSAFESLFENVDKGKKAWKSFTETIEKDAMKDTYKQFIEPVLQSGFGMLIPSSASSGSSGIPSASKGGTSSALGGLFHSILPGVPGLGGAMKGGSAPIVQIINQTSSPAQGTATSQSQDDGSGMTEALTPHVIQIVLQDLTNNGQIGQAMTGLGLMAG